MSGKTLDLCAFANKRRLHVFLFFRLWLQVCLYFLLYEKILGHQIKQNICKKPFARSRVAAYFRALFVYCRSISENIFLLLMLIFVKSTLVISERACNTCKYYADAQLINAATARLRTAP